MIPSTKEELIKDIQLAVRENNLAKIADVLIIILDYL